MNILDHILHPEQLWAHTSPLLPPESLSAHIHMTQKQFLRLFQKNGVKRVVERSIARSYPFLSKRAQEWLQEAFCDAVVFHDIGKINPGVQYHVMKNPFVSYKEAKRCDRHHALLSAVLYLHIYSKKINAFRDESFIMTQKAKAAFCSAVATFAYAISRHHTHLQDLSVETFLGLAQERLNIWKETPNILCFYRGKGEIFEGEWISSYYAPPSHENEMAGYILLKLLYSSIVASDFYASYAYFNEKEVDFQYLDTSDKKALLERYQTTSVYQSIQATKMENFDFATAPMNVLRSQLFLETFERLKPMVNQYSLFYLEAPTGSGKTNTALHLALQTLCRAKETNKLLYIFPFNSLADQTQGVLRFSLGDRYRIQVLNSVTPLLGEGAEQNEISDQKRSVDYNEELIMRQMWQYPITLTSHVNFFHVLFGTSREANLALVHLCNSVVILDEIQGYRSAIWKEIIAFLMEFGECFGIKFFVMSATLPRLHELIDTDLSYGELLPDAGRYMQHDMFKKRVKMNFEALAERWSNSEQGFKWIHDKIREYPNKRILVQFIRKRTASDFFDYLRKHGPDLPVQELTGDDNRLYRKKVIGMLQEKNEETGDFVLQHVVLVATQVIEAGVDIDTDIGFKDISILDAEEQFLGRINRSNNRSGCVAYFFNLDPAGSVYIGDWRLELNITHDIVQIWAQNKTFAPFYQHVMQRMKEDKNRFSSDPLYNYSLFLSVVGDWKFKRVAEHMKLIDKEEIRLFLNCTLQDEKGRVWDGKEVWERYKELLENRKLSYAEHRIKMIQIGAELGVFTYGVQCDPSRLPPYETIGDLHFVEDGERFMREDARTAMKRFHRASLLEDWG